MNASFSTLSTSAHPNESRWPLQASIRALSRSRTASALALPTWFRYAWLCGGGAPSSRERASARCESEEEPCAGLLVIPMDNDALSGEAGAAEGHASLGAAGAALADAGGAADAANEP